MTRLLHVALSNFGLGFMCTCVTAEYLAIPKHFLKQWLCGYMPHSHIVINVAISRSKNVKKRKTLHVNKLNCVAAYPGF